MEILGFDHVQLAMPQGGEVQARAFYVDVLGMTEVTKPKALQARGGVWFTWGAVQLHLGVQMPFAPATKAHPGILVRNLEAVRTHCQDRGIDFTEGMPIPGYDRLDLHDPFGNRLEFLQRLPD